MNLVNNFLFDFAKVDNVAKSLLSWVNCFLIGVTHVMLLALCYIIITIIIFFSFFPLPIQKTMLENVGYLISLLFLKCLFSTIKSGRFEPKTFYPRKHTNVNSTKFILVISNFLG